VLIADDTRGVADRMKELVESVGDFEVLVPANDGIEAIERFDAECPDAAILDFSMPRASGLDVIRSIRASGRACLVVIASGTIDPSICKACMAAGADHVITKSNGIAELPLILSALYHPVGLQHGQAAGE